MAADDETAGPTITPAGGGPVLMQIADRVLGRPLLLHPQKAEVILHVLQGRLPIDAGALAALGPEANRFVGTYQDDRGKTRTYRVDGGVAMISIVGSLVNRGAWLGTSSGMVSYEGLARQIGDAASDPKVRSILLDIDSPGGEATGMFTLAAKVREVAAIKPVVAVVNDMAASAAYGIASQASEIVVSPTSIVGSIGVVLTHLDRSGELQQKGIKPTLIYAGRHKVDGNPFGPLTDAVMGDLQAEVAKFYDQFVGLVAQGRGERLTEQDARATEARTFLGQDAVDRGLADRVASFDAVLASLQQEQPPRSGQQKGSRQMADQTTTPAAGITQEAHTAAVNAARAEGIKAGADAERARIASIMGHAEAQGREKQALAIALDAEFAGLSADAVGKLLAVSPKGAEASAGAGIKTIADRAAGAAEMGADATNKQSAAEASRSVWGAAVKQANASLGVNN